jgi:hypothetical protein
MYGYASEGVVFLLPQKGLPHRGMPLGARMTSRSRLAGAAALLLASTMGSAQANTVDIYQEQYNGGGTGLYNTVLATLTSAGSGLQFAGFTYDTDTPGAIGGVAQTDRTSAYTAVAFNLGNSGDGTETTFARNLAETTAVTFSGRTEIPDALSEATTFSVAAGYFAIKVGEYTAFFQNLTAPATLSLSFSQEARAAGLSHVTVYNGTVAVPGPIAGAGLPALLALGGFVWARRRKAAAVAA